MDPREFEKLGVFYLGRVRDAAGEPTAAPLLYDSRDLLTHGVCVGMTGSGKTGLCLALLEEAALDGVPAIAIDPKGDLGNLLLTFPELSADEFREWVDEGAAVRAGVTPEEHAAAEAKLWREGLAGWGQDGDRIRRLRAAADFTIYTPGSTAGRPLSILHSLDAPPAAVRDDTEALGDRVSSAASSLLGLIGIAADPLKSREHILLSTILHHAWRAGENVDLGGLIQRIQDPPERRIGVVDVDAFFPPKDRFDLAMRVNGILAAPGFQTWLEGDPISADRLLFGPDGRPRVSIVSIAHLSEAERMFAVTLILNEVVGWVRAQPGTSSLRAILYMDEIFGFFPPVAEPPSKRPLLTLLKQARAHGLGVVLATQNPVDLDYKGLSNAGTWWIGRLQTERDKARVIEGLEGATAGFGAGMDRAAMERVLAGLGKRVFLMHNVHEKAPVVFDTRWVMSYMRGPLTRDEIRRLTPPEEAGAPVAPSAVEPPASAPAAAPGPAPAAARPALPPDLEELFVPPMESTESLRYRPAVLAIGEVHFEDKKAGVSETTEAVVVAPFVDGPVPVSWDETYLLDIPSTGLGRAPLEGAAFGELPPEALDSRRWTRWRKDVADWLYRNRTLEIRWSEDLEMGSTPGESERDFRVRLHQRARERRDEAAEALRGKYASRTSATQRRVQTAEDRLQREAAESKDARLQTVISIGATLLGSVLGGKGVGRATTAARGAGRAMKRSGDVARAEEALEKARREMAELDEGFREELADLESRHDPATTPLETREIRPTRAGVKVRAAALGWIPSPGPPRA